MLGTLLQAVQKALKDQISASIQENVANMKILPFTYILPLKVNVHMEPQLKSFIKA